MIPHITTGYSRERLPPLIILCQRTLFNVKEYAAYSCKITHESKRTLSDIRSFIHATVEKQIP